MPNPSTYTSPPSNFAGFVSRDDAFEAMHRFDSPHYKPEELIKPQAPNDSLDRRGFVAPDGLADSTISSEPIAPELFPDIDSAAIRAAHADDLIEFLQRWSEDLDARSARLHADMATHERRERAFRLWMQNRRSELETQLAEHQLAQSRVEAAARRFAIEQDL